MKLNIWSKLSCFIVILALNLHLIEGYKDQQIELLIKAKMKCNELMQKHEYPTSGIFCNITFDNLLCWNYTSAGSLARQRCPTYIHKFTDKRFATRLCLLNGNWSPRDGSDGNITKGWTNFSECFDRSGEAPTFIREHMQTWRIIYNVGYSTSLFSLLVAIFIMIYFRKLHNHRNTIHNNLFISFILRATVCLLRDNLFIQGVAFESDLVKNEDGRLYFNENITHWQCKLFYTFFYYSLLANYTWILVEGLYIHALLFWSVFNKKHNFYCYISFGWRKIVYENFFCWNTHPTSSYWIFNSAIMASIIVNFIFYINIIRMIFQKIYVNARPQISQYTRLAKSTLILIPLFGVHYIITLLIPEKGVSDLTKIAKIYLEHIFSSFQGLMVAILFCFLNEEVQTEIKMAWKQKIERKSFHHSRTITTFSSLTRERQTDIATNDSARCSIHSETQSPNLGLDCATSWGEQSSTNTVGNQYLVSDEAGIRRSETSETYVSRKDTEAMRLSPKVSQK
ncbi:secretin receptor-like isoform X1 [Octopus vulgaris]|uniref:Secretin receptor-like isoform X1 n=1 Tax=Octopus vulgaris TaxID=6645 RepID=A0AA36EW21_OCTVU|nr:secretin receptor-like isoform X1 [Octopus vulgaris]